MSDEVEVTSTSWLSRLGSSIKGVLIGMVLVVASIILLWWNEGRSVREYKKISFAREHTVETPYESIDSSKEGQLVHFAGKASTSDVLTEPTFGVSVKDSYRMSGKVEVFQWIEDVIPGETKEEKQIGGSVKKTKMPDRYEYRKGWSDKIISSDNFHEKVDNQTGEVRKNPYTTLPYADVNNEILAKSVKIGAHDLPADRIRSLGSSKSLELVANQLKLPANAVVDKNAIYIRYNSTAAVTPATTVTPTVPATTDTTVQTIATDSTVAPVSPQATVVNTAVPQTATTGNTFEERLGDIRITFTYVPMDVVTVIAKLLLKSMLSMMNYLHILMLDLEKKNLLKKKYLKAMKVQKLRQFGSYVS